MAMKCAGSLALLLVTTSILAATACPPCPCSGGSWAPPGINATKPKTVIIGESENWHWGYDYASWALNYSMKSPFFVGDTLVFKYTTEHTHSVVLLPDYQSYQSCDVKNAKMLGKPGDGINGVKFKLTAKKQKEDPHFYFACGEDNGGHCSTGKMRFSVYPVPRY